MARRLRRCVFPVVALVLLSSAGVVSPPRPAGAVADSTGVTSRVSVRSGGAQADAEAPADNLVPGDTNDTLDVFVYDRQQSTVTRVSVAGDGSQADGDSRSPSIDDTGTVVAFTSSATNLVPGDTNGKTDVFVRTLGSSPSSRLVSAAAGGSTPGNGAS